MPKTKSCGLSDEIHKTFKDGSTTYCKLFLKGKTLTQTPETLKVTEEEIHLDSIMKTALPWY